MAGAQQPVAVDPGAGPRRIEWTADLLPSRAALDASPLALATHIAFENLDNLRPLADADGRADRRCLRRACGAPGAGARIAHRGVEGDGGARRDRSGRYPREDAYARALPAKSRAQA
jgi:hypothetical protein